MTTTTELVTNLRPADFFSALCSRGGMAVADKQAARRAFRTCSATTHFQVSDASNLSNLTRNALHGNVTQVIDATWFAA